MGLAEKISQSDCDMELSAVRALLFQRERELREVHHRVANSLQLAAGFLTLQRKKFDDPALKAALEEGAQRLAAVGKLHRYLYAHSASSGVDFKAFLEDLCPEIAASTGLRCAIDADASMVSGELAQNLAIVINELALNASKHGYGGAQGGDLKIQCRCSRHRLRLTVADGGRGLGDHFDPRAGGGLGMSIVHSIVLQFHGTLEAQDDHGARFTLTMPLP